MSASKAAPAGPSHGNLAATYALIHSFLTSRSHDKAAAAVKKAAKDIVVLKDDVKGEDVALDDIVNWWKLKKEVDSKNESKSDSGSNSSSDSDSSDSSSDSSDSDSSSSISSSSSNSDSSSSDSSSDSSDSSEPKTAKAGKGASKTANATSADGKGVIVSQSMESSQTLSEGSPKKSKKTKPAKAVKAKASSSSGSSDDSSSSDSDSDSSSPAPKAKSTPKSGHIVSDATNIKTTVVSVAVSEPLDARATKKRRTSESGNAVVTAVVTETTETTPAPKQNGKTNGKQPRKSNTPFQRIKAEGVEFHDERLKDNAFVAKGGTMNDYGARANEDLIVTRGDGFRKEKNKKKRGSYRGGEITMQSHSIKFT